MHTVDEKELEKFATLKNEWWDKEGALKTLHDINPARIDFIEKFTSLKGKRVLDVGCGGGILSEALAKKGALVTAIDLEASAITVAANHAKESKIDIDYQHIALEALNMADFDIVVCYEMLEHVPNPNILVSQLAEKLTPNGHLFLSTLNRTLKAYLYAIVGAEYLLQILPKQTHDYKKFITPSELSRYVRTTGLSVQSMSGLNYHPLTRHTTLTSDVSVNYLMHCVND
jgi:2-polyprenyl-6-hydroxyphenyl methylase/3-demethylubiquinone-9 3-methyltransferase